MSFSLIKTTLAIAIASKALIAEETAWQITVQWDNDLLTSTGSDDGYTNGARIAFTKEIAPSTESFNWLQRQLFRLSGADKNNLLSDLQFPETQVDRFQWGIGISQLMFTPQNPQSLTPPVGERPYAGWAGLEFSLLASGGDSASTATLSIGTTGPLSYADDAQRWVHQNISDSPVFQGWESQAPAELTINLHFDHKQRLPFFDTTEEWPIEFDGFYEWGASLGNFRTDAYLGAQMRMGYQLPEVYAEPRVQLGSFTNTIFEDSTREPGAFSIYTYVGLRGYTVLHDITLDGPTFRDWKESVDSEPWVGEGSFGAAIQWKGVELSLSHTIRSDEFEGQKNRSRYGSVLLRFSAPF